MRPNEEVINFIMSTSEILVNVYHFVQISDFVFEGILDNVHKDKYLLKESNGIEYINHLLIDIEPLLFKDLPIVKEIDHKIPKRNDYHNSLTNGFCFGVLIGKNSIFGEIVNDFSIFVDKYIHGYLFAAKYMEIYGEWPSDEYNHNFKIAVIEEMFDYFDYVHVDNSSLIKFVNIIISNSGKSYCGSKRMYIFCHKSKVDEVFEYINKQKYINFVIKFLVVRNS
jgi:hypothetical protein